jgi:ubiquinol-cytochrome c reductase core subunit 2
MVKALEFTDEQSSTYLATPQVRVNEELHRVAFRKGLGQASIASNEALNGLKRSDLADFVQNHFTKDRIAVVATGVNHDELVELVETSFDGIELKGSSEKPPMTKYYGGESRIDAGPNSTALFSVAFEGSSTNPSDYYTSLVLAELLNSSTGVKYSCSSKIGTESTTVTGFSTSYSDSGLVGFTVKGLNSEVKQVAQNAINELKGATAISSNAFESAKKAAIISFETNSTRSNILESLGKESTSSFVFGVEGFEMVTVDVLKQVIFD